MSKISIRHSEPYDLDQIKALYAEPSSYAGTLQLPHPKDSLWHQRLSADDKNHFSLVALIDDDTKQADNQNSSIQRTKIVGQLGLHVNDNHRRKHVADIGMAVSEHYRGHGIGSKLLQEAISLATNWLAITRIELEVYTDNEAAVALYQKHQFKIEGTAKNHAFREGKLVDSYYMARLI